MDHERFPLFKLSEKFIKRVIKIMPDIERVVISFCSKRMKSLAVSPGVRSRCFFITICRNCEVSYIHTSRSVSCGLDRDIGNEKIRVGQRGSKKYLPITWDQPGWSFLERFNHVQDLFPDNESVRVSFYSDTLDLNFLPLFRISDVSSLYISEGQRNSYYNLQLFKHFEKVNEIGLNCPRFDCNTQVASVLTRNLHKLEIRLDFKITFNELLLVNCEYLHLEHQRLNAEQINMFLKLWIRGSHPHLRYFQCNFDDSTQLRDLDRLLIGTNFRYLPNTKKTRYIDFNGIKDKIFGGYEIWSKDKIKGIVKIHEYTAVFEFLVIDD